MWVVVAILTFTAASIEPGRVGLATDGDVDVLRWSLLAPLYLLPLVTVALSSRLRNVLHGPFALLVAAATLTLVVAPLGESAPGDVLLATGALSLALLSAVLVERLGFSRFVQLLGNVTFVLCAISLVEATEARPGRLAGLYPAANAFGVHGALLIVEGVRRWSTERPSSRGTRSMPLVPVAFVVLGVVVIFESQARMAFIAAVVASIVLVWRALPEIVIGIAAASVLVILVAAGLTGRLDALTVDLSRSGDTAELTSVTGRTGVWEHTVELIGERPLTGYGFNGNVEVLDQAFADGDIEFEASEAHNIVLQAAMNGGVVPALLLVASLISFARRIQRRPHPVASAMVALIVVHGLTESMIREPKDLWMLLAAAFAAVSWPSDQLDAVAPAHGLANESTLVNTVAVSTALAVMSSQDVLPGSPLLSPDGDPNT
jgi:O-antigen ligase